MLGAFLSMLLSTLTWSLTTGKRAKRQFHKTAPAVNVSLAIQVDEQLGETVKKLCCLTSRVLEAVILQSIKIF